MFLSSVVLYFEDKPVGYEVFKEDQSLLFQPAINSQPKAVSIIFKATKSAEGWVILNAYDPDLREQIQKIIDVH